MKSDSERNNLQEVETTYKALLFSTYESYINLPDVQFSVVEVVKAIEELDVDKGPGMDGIPPLLLKNCSTALASPITSLFNRSLHDRMFPVAWKSASIIPIYKSGNCNRVTNYRGVSVFSKNWCITFRITPYLH